MILEHTPLARQLDIVFKQLKEELSYLSSGTLFIQIRNNSIGKFGIRHFPMESRGSQLQMTEKGLSEAQFISFHQTAKESLKFKKWTHGEICFEFALKQNMLCTSIQFESNYNMANILSNNDKIY
ncbi:O-methyltransferase [Paenibacillus thalictri]|uniref:O-methyltransferase n=1 Tax=Paenibacillus thalictri TaxID=2527873 RepID=A0A4Q9DNF4_9BACL|nr:O-methyltransferase [Paenibacillus thalictri]TBL75065.1 O-methyltransferase [Paenibacillus thalictri]